MQSALTLRQVFVQQKRERVAVAAAAVVVEGCVLDQQKEEVFNVDGERSRCHARTGAGQSGNVTGISGLTNGDEKRE
ncbi:hypothetical protein GBF38_005370 [Nibea albiflora]|uniref:Uncharacterized protein n=1 Tax=Nibea albiflora TaxID=240163 RepID=A0ACB7EVM2_NIBAL|nr:hypothetical protein GBF38_005370 [Nibea albiflora]